MLITFKLMDTQNVGGKIFAVYKKWLTEEEWMLIGTYQEEDGKKVLIINDSQVLTMDALAQIIAFSKH